MILSVCFFFLVKLNKCVYPTIFGLEEFHSCILAIAFRILHTLSHWYISSLPFVLLPHPNKKKEV